MILVPGYIGYIILIAGVIYALDSLFMMIGINRFSTMAEKVYCLIYPIMSYNLIKIALCILGYWKWAE